VDWKVEEQTPDTNGGDEGSGKLCAARGNFPLALEGAEDVFNDVPCPIQFMIVRSLLFPAFNRRGDGCYIRFPKHIGQFVCVIRFVRKERFLAFKPSIRRGAWLYPRQCPLAGIPYLSTTKCNFAVQPLLCG
jgi:hypothetical protein